jgi:hypothetical protein
MGSLGGPEVIVRLGYDPKDLKVGLDQAKTDVANFKGQAVLLETQLKTEKLRLQTEFTSANRAATQQRIADLNQELQSAIGSLARKSAAEKSALMEHVQALRQQREAEISNLSAFDQQIAKVNQLRAAYLQASSAAKQSQAATGIFAQMSGAPSMIGVLQAQLAQMSGIVPGLARLSQLLVGVSFSSGEAEASIVGMTGVLARFGGPVIAVAAGLAGVTFAAAKAALSVGEWAHGLEQTAQRTGLSVEKLQQLEFIGKATGFTLDNLVKINRTLAIAIVEGNPAFDMLGVKTRTANGQLREEYDVLLDLADAFQKMPEGVAKIAVATELSSRFGQAMIPTLNLGSQGIRELSAEAERFAPKIKELAEAHAKWDIANAKLSASITLLKGDLAGMMPILTSVVGKLAEFLRAAEKSGVMKLPIVPAILATPALAGAELVLEHYAPKPAPKAPVPPVPPSSLQVPGGIPPFEGIKVTLARKELADAETAAGLKNLSIDQQIVEVQKQLNALKAGEATVSETQKVLNIKEEIRLTAELATLGKEKAKAEEEYTLKLKAANDELQKAYGWQVKMAEGRLVDTVGERGARAADLKAAQGQMVALQSKAVDLSGTDLIANKKEQAELEKQIGELVLATDAATKKLKADNESLTTEIEKQIAEAQRGQNVLGDLLGTPRKPVALAGAKPILPFEGQLTDIQASRAVGLTSAQQEIDSLKALAGPLGDEIKLREANLAGMDQELDGYKAQRDELQKMIELLHKISTASAEAGKQTPMAQMFGTLKEFGDIVGKFSSSFGKEFQHMFAATEAIQKSFKSLQELGGTRIGGILQPTNFATIMRNIFITQPSDPNVLLGQKGAPPRDNTKDAASVIDMAGIGVSMVGQFQNALGGPGGLKGAVNSALGMGMSGAMLGFEASGGNPIGAVVGGGIGLVAGGIMGAFGSGKAQKKATDAATAISLAVQKITDSLNLGATDLKTAISQIKAQQVVASQISGKGTKSTKIQVQQQLDQQLNQLQAQQKQILDKFHATLGILQLPEGAQGTAQSIQQIAAALKEAAGAGATAAEQLQFYNLSVQALTTTLGRTLRSDEQGTLDALRQEISLREQRADILKSAADQELAIRQSLGVQRTLTPGQQAAKQIADIEVAKNKQLAALTEQENTLKAQINGQAELYGWSLKDLDIAGAKAKLIAEQLDLTQQITAETIAQIKAQQDYYATLLSGKLPTLPAGTLPSGFMFPTGGTAPTGVGGVTMSGPITIQVSFPQFPPLPGSPTSGAMPVGAWKLPTPAQIADSLQQAIELINSRRYLGLE